ncbi:MAG: hypothetical protein IJW06_06165 [Clostridia bacterium]|nr:hypothetical protein [Clostridia bacterium]
MTKGVLIKKTLFDTIISELSCLDYEKGGILGQKVRGQIDEFFLDALPKSASISSYTPDIDVLEKTINSVWKHRGITFCGFVHSHINTSYASQADIDFIRRFCKVNCLDEFMLGIVNSKSGTFHLYSISNQLVKELSVLSE